MAKTTDQANKVLVLEAFDTLFNKRDYKAAERYRSTNYMVHEHRKAEELDCRRYRPCGRRRARRTLGRIAGRSNRSRIAERSADVRYQISRLRSWAKDYAS